MGNKKIGLGLMLNLIGAMFAYLIGSGFASGQETMQYFSGWGSVWTSLGVAVIALLLSCLAYIAYVYMPPTCSCATTAAPAAAAGVAFLHGLTPQQINDMLCTAQVQMAGVVCDGAKPSCATRMYVALFGSLQAMMMAKEGIRATNVEGFVHNDLKVTLENLYRLQHDVLHNKVDAILWDIVKEQKVIH